jgi:Ca2+-binding EF-hand superfamily protein
VKNKWIQNITLYEILKEYDQSLTENQSRLLVRYLQMNYEESDRVDYKEFTAQAFKLFDKLELRETRELQLFFSSIPLANSAGVIDEIPSDSTFSKGQPPTGTNSLPVPMSAAIEAVIIDYILRIKQNFRILTKSDAEVAFKRMDVNKNKVVSRLEFDNMAKQFIPEITDSVRLQLYKMFDKNNTGNFNLEQFTDIVINKVPQHLDRMEILLYKTEPYAQTIMEIVSKLDLQKKRLTDLFSGQELVKRQKILDVFDLQLKVLDPTKKIPQLLDLLEFEQAGGRVIKVEELNEILDTHKPKKNNIIDMFEPTSPTSSRHGYVQPTNDRIDQVIENIRKAISDRSENAVYILFNKVDKNADHMIEFPEFFSMLRQFDKQITEKEAKSIFKKVDFNRTETISQDEFVDFFGMRGIIENDATIIDRIRRKDTTFDPILEDLTKAIAAHNTTPERIFSHPDDVLKKKQFEQSLQVFKINPDKYHNYNDFIKAIELKKNPLLVDLSKLKLLLNQFYKQNKNVVTKDMSSIVDIFIYDLLRCFNDTEVILSTFDQNRNQIITYAEFVIVTNQHLGADSYTKADLDSIYRSLKGDDKDLSRFVFQMKLIEVQNKYNQVGASFIGGGTSLNTSIDLGSPLKGMPHSASRQGGNMFDFERTHGDQSMPGLPASSSRGKLTEEEKKRSEITATYVKLRDMINYRDEELLDELKSIDKDGKNCLHPHYIWQALKKLGAPETSFSDTEKGLLFDQVAKSGEMYFYLDFVRRIFPSKQLVNIATAKDLVEELLKQQQVRKETLSMLVKEAFAGDETKDMDYTQFEKFLSARGLLLSDDTLNSIFGEFDKELRRKVSAAQFKGEFTKDGVDGAVKLKNNLKTFLKALNKTTKEAFEPLASKTKDFEFKDFADALVKLNHTIKYIEIETLFTLIDVDKSGKLSIDELAKQLDPPVEKVIETIDSTVIRKAMYKEVKSKYHGFQHFFETFDSNSKKYLSLDDFGKMLTAVKVEYKDIKADVRPMYEAINVDKNYRLSMKELQQFYDESTILLLFPVITQFRSTFLEYMKTKMEPAYFLIARHNVKADNELTIDDFKDLLKTIGLKADKEQSELIFNELDYSGDKKVTPSELRRCLASSIIDVVGLAETISTTLYRRGVDTRVAFTQVNANNDDGLNFVEFHDLIVKNLNLNLSLLEVEEIFEFAVTGQNSKITLADFVNLFSSTRKVNPFLHNKKYMEGLPEETRKYYMEKYRGLIQAKGNLRAYDRNADKELLDQRRRLPGGPNNLGFQLDVVESGDQALPAGPGAKEPEIVETDIVFGLRMKSRAMDQRLEMSFKGAITDNATNFMVPDDLNRMVKDLNMTVKEDELKALFNRIHSYGTDPADKVSVGTFVKYANAVFDSIKKSKESGVNLRGIAGPAIKKYLIYERILPEDYFKRYKLRSKDCLLFHEFTKMIQDLQLAIEPSNEEINKLFQFLNKEKEDEMLTYQEFLDIFNDPADVVNQINKSKHESLLLEVKVKIFYKDSLQNKRW